MLNALVCPFADHVDLDDEDPPIVHVDGEDHNKTRTRERTASEPLKTRFLALVL